MGEQRGLWRWLWRGGASTEVEEELSFHLTMRARELESRGAEPEEARREARRRFGDVDRVAAECRRILTSTERKMRRTRYIAELAQDARQAVRQFGRSRGFTAVAVLTLGIGIGATTAIFSVVDGILLRPLPYPASDRLVASHSQDRKSGDMWYVTYADYEDWRREGVFAHVALFQPMRLNAVGDAGPERVEAAVTTEDFFPALGLAPLLGHLPGPDLYRPGSGRTAVISYGLWQRRFGGARDVVGRTLRLTGGPAEIVAVMPPQLDFPAGTDVWVPFRQTPADRPELRERDNYIFDAVARLAPGATLESTRARLATLAARVEREETQTRAAVTVTAEPLADGLVGRTLTRMLWILLGAVAFVLLIGCVNVANLLLSRSTTRARELAVRAALGAGRGRLLRQLLTESALLGAVGGALGVLLAFLGVKLLVAYAPGDTPRLGDVRLSIVALAFALGISLLSALLFGLAPALHMSADARAARSLAGEDVRTTAGRRGRRSRRALIVAELALSLVLLVGAGLLLRSLLRLTRTDPGFSTAHVVTFELALQGDRYEPDGATEGFYRSLLERVRALPGVESASAVSSLPIGGGGLYLGRAFLPEGRPEPPAGEEVIGPWVVAEPGSFRTLRLPLLKGRDFTDADNAGSTPVMIVNREFARRTFGGESAVGKRVRSWRDENVYREIVGVVDDVRFFSAGDSIRPVVYVPHAQNEWGQMEVIVRSSAPVATLMAGVRRELAGLDASLPISNVQTMDRVFRDSVAPQRTAALLMSLFAVVALVLAAVGTYGVLAYLVAHRRREIGVRMALGASSGDVARMVVREAALLVALALALGTTGALVLSRLLTSVLYEVPATDVAVYVAVPVLLGAVALIASWLPARRAASVDPALAMRVET